MRHYTGFFDMAAIVSGLACIMIGQVGGACFRLVPTSVMIHFSVALSLSLNIFYNSFYTIVQPPPLSDQEIIAKF